MLSRFLLWPQQIWGSDLASDDLVHLQSPTPPHRHIGSAAQFNSSRYAATSSAMFSQRFTVDTRFSAAFAMSAVKQAFPVPTTGSWPEYAARVDLISNSTFQAFVVREKMWPFVVSATLDQTRREGTFRVQLHHSTIIGAASVFSVPLFLVLWVSFQDPSVVSWHEKELSMLWQAFLASACFFGGQVWWQSRCVCQSIRRILADDNAA